MHRLAVHDFPVREWFFSNLAEADIKPSETSMEDLWIGKDWCHTSSKLIYVTPWKISDLYRTSSPNLHVVLTCMGAWFSRVGLVWFGLVKKLCFRKYIGEEISQETKDTKKWKDGSNSEGRNGKNIKHSIYISWTPINASLELKNLKAPLASQLKAASQSW